MKKLMTIAATSAFAFCAFGELTSTGFEATPYVAGAALDTAKDDAGRTNLDGGFAKTWLETDIDEGAAVVTAWEESTEAHGSNYLALDGAPRIERYAQVGGNPVKIGDGLYIDTLVQFTATDPESAPEVGASDKLCVWLKENAEDGDNCTLMVTAGYVNDDVGAEILTTNYVTTTTLATNSWHRLQVKVLTAIDSEDTDALGDGFIVLIDGNVVATTTCPINSEYLQSYTLNARAATYMTDGNYKIFPSLIARGGSGDGEITSVSFEGSGAVDNIEFTQGADIDPIVIPAELEPVLNGESFTYTGEAIKGVSYDEDKAYGYEFVDDEGYSLGTEVEVGDYTTTARLYYGYAWSDGTTANKTYHWSIVEKVTPPAPTTYALTIAGGDNATVVATTNGVQVVSGTLVLDGQEVVVVATPGEGYEYASAPEGGWALSEGAITQTFTVNGGALEITVPAAAQVEPAHDDWADNPETAIAEGATAQQAYPALADSALAEADAKELTNWAKANNIDFATVQADTTGANVNAFLLNCALDDVEDEKKDFVPTITIVDGVPTVTAPAGKEYNGKLQMKGKVNLSDAEWTDLEAPSTTYKFYKYELSL